MKRILLAIFFMAAFSAAGAQNGARNYISHLSLAEPANGARVIVHQDAAATSALDAIPSSSDRINGMRITVFFDNSQNARGAAAAAQSQVGKLFPGVPTYVIYKDPTFMVQAGNCLDRREAAYLRGMLKPFFPGATIVYNIPIPFSSLSADPTVIPAEPEGGEPISQEAPEPDEDLGILE